MLAMMVARVPGTDSTRWQGDDQCERIIDISLSLILWIIENQFTWSQVYASRHLALMKDIPLRAFYDYTSLVYLELF